MSDQQQSASAELDEFSTLDDDFGPIDDVADFTAEAEDKSVESDEVVIRRDKISISGPVPWSLGLFNLLSAIVIVAATVFGYVAATTGVYDPRVLVEHFRGLDTGTLNILTMVGGGIAILALLGALALSRALLPVRRQAEDSESLLAAISNLDLEIEDGWMDEDLRLHSGVDRFLTATLGAYRLLQSRLTKYVSLEGELFRMEKSVAADQRIDLSDTYDHPGAGRLASALLKLQGERDDARRERDENAATLHDAGVEICSTMVEAVRWNNSALDQLNVQTESLEKLVRASAEAASELNQGARRQETDGAGQDVIVRIRAELASLPNTDSSLVLSAATGTIKDLVARGGKLAIQSAMEIARLGDRAGQLTNMSQELQTLITEFRAVATQLESLSGTQAKFSAVLTDTRRKLDSFNPGAGLGRQLQDAGTRVGDMQRDVGQSVALFGKLSRDIDSQSSRLDGIGSALADLSGAAWEISQAGMDLDGEPAAEKLSVDRFDPFGSEPGQTEVKPASPADAKSPASGAKQFHVSPFEVDGVEAVAESAPGMDIEAFSSGAKVEDTSAAVPEPGLIDMLKSVSGAEQSVVEAADAPTPVKEALPSTPEKVYDLSDFDAVPVSDDESPGSAQSDRIYDLAEFGAVPVT